MTIKELVGQILPNEYIQMLCSPRTHHSLELNGDQLVSKVGERYQISRSGIPIFATGFLSDAAESQQQHYDDIVDKYVENLNYPHTQEYMAYLDRQLFNVLPESLGTVAELCCGRGEAARLLHGRMSRCIGVDISTGMLEIARRDLAQQEFLFLQGDATELPLKEGIVDNVVMLGGIHHVPDRSSLFNEVHRILKPGGRFFFREPLDDFMLWRAIRKVIYRMSSTLDHETERPLLRKETESALIAAGFDLLDWRTYGFFGFCLFMNSDVLVFNRLFCYLPGIRSLTRLACQFDHWMTEMPQLRHAGLQVIGVAQRSLDQP